MNSDVGVLASRLEWGTVKADTSWKNDLADGGAARQFVEQAIDV
jgi:hypothetical protein